MLLTRSGLQQAEGDRGQAAADVREEGEGGQDGQAEVGDARLSL